MIDPAEVIRAWNRISPEVRQLADAFASPGGAGRRYVLGRNEHSAALAKAIEVDAFVDDFVEPGLVWNGKPVVKGPDVPSDGIVVNCSLCTGPVSAARRLANLSIAGVLSLSDLCKSFPDRIQLPDFVLATRRDLTQNWAKWKHLAEHLEDAESKQVLDDILAFRLTGDYSSMRAYSVRTKDQYFEDFLDLAPGEVFVDAGGFDGDTTEEFCRRCPTYRKVLLFEPSSGSLKKARVRLQNMRDVEFYGMGLSDVVGTLPFNPNTGSASAVNESGPTQIQATTLDIDVHDVVTFIKMDLEGWELRALVGSRRHIQEEHPKLAVAVYHHPSDFWRIHHCVKGLGSNYKVRLRHYTEGWSETVMYFALN